MSNTQQISLPKFLDDYLLFASNNEAPMIYHLYSALAVLSACIGRKVKVVNGDFVFYPHTYTVLVGDPAAGKSTALSIGKNLIRSVKGIREVMTAESMTVESLTRWMSGTGLTDGAVSPCGKTFKNSDGKIEQYTQASIIVGELVSFLAVAPHAWIIFLTTVFDEEVYEVKTKNKGDDLLVGPYVTLFGCLTPDISQQMQTAKIISTGFARRTLFVWAGERGAPMAIMERKPEFDEARNRCIAYLNDLTRVHGTFDWRPAEAWYKHWYDGRFQYEKSKVATQHTIGYYSSKNMQMFKLAMLISLSEDFELVLRPHHFELAEEFLRRIELNLFRVFGGSGRNEDAPVALAIMERLEREKDAIPLKKLQADFWGEVKMGRVALDAIFHHLEVIGKIEKWDELIGSATCTFVATPEGRANFKKKLARIAQQGPLPAGGTSLDFELKLRPPSEPSAHPEEKSSPEDPASP